MAEETLKSAAIQGRGVSGNPKNRFEAMDRIRTDDGWELQQDPSPQTVVLHDVTKSILSHNDSPDIPFEYSVNPYRGCEHGCTYCYARPTHEYLGLSSGLDFETKIFVKRSASDLLRKELQKKSWVPQAIVMSGVTDCYQPVERELKVTRACLEVLNEFGNPVIIITKNALVARDIDILGSLAKKNAALVVFSVTTLDSDLARISEPRASTPGRRLMAIEALTQAGIAVSVNVAPVIPAITDHEIPEILKAAAKAGATSAHYTMLRLPHAVAPLFETWLGHHFPERKNKVLARVKEMRGGKLYDSQFGSRMRGVGTYACQIETLFRVSRNRAGLSSSGAELSIAHFKRQDPSGQMDLF